MKVLYFAWVRQKIGRSEETFALPAGVTTIDDLVGALRARGDGYAAAFADKATLRAARNQEHVDFSCAISNDDEIAFFPPVTGG